MFVIQECIIENGKVSNKFAIVYITIDIQHIIVYITIDIHCKNTMDIMLDIKNCVPVIFCSF